MNAPVALFVYNRPEHTKKTLDSLSVNLLAKETVLYVFCDGPKDKATDEEQKRINEVLMVVKNEERFQQTIIFESPTNKGLASSIISGIDEVFINHDNIIVLEDDILTSKYFLKFCNAALEKYKTEKRVMSISGFTFPASKKLPETFFLSIVACWGWATWKDRWQELNKDAVALLDEINQKNSIFRFNFNDSYDYYSLLKEQAEGKINSWAIRWYATVFLKNGLTLYPGKSLTKNIGMDGTGTHFTGVVNNKKGGIEVEISQSVKEMPILTNIIENKTAIENKFQKYLSNIYSYSFALRLMNKIKQILKRNPKSLSL